MPSREFMDRVLSTGRADVEEPEDEVEEPLTAEGQPDDGQEPLEDEVETPEPESPEEVEQPEEQEEAAPEEEEQQPEEEEPEEAAQEEPEFYLGTYRNREEAEKGWLEKEQHISRQADELQQLRQQMAEMQGYLQGVSQQPSQPGEFEAWAEQYLDSGNAVGGANEALQASMNTGDPSYIDQYVALWSERGSSEAFEASRYIGNIEREVALREMQQQIQQQMPPPPNPQQDMINESWVELARTDPDLGKPGEYAEGVSKVLLSNPVLTAGAMSGDPEKIRNAIAIARDGYRMQAARTDNGTPRKVKSSDAERLREDKLAATVTTGDSSPDRGGSTPEVPPELQEMMERIQAGEGGMPRLRE